MIPMLRAGAAAAALAACALTSHLLAAQAGPLAGTWRGTSVCLVNRGVCHDESVVYHVAPAPAGADGATWTITMNKVVNGSEEEMDVLRCTTDAALTALTCPMPPGRRPGTWSFTRAGRLLHGWLLATDGTRIRVIDVRRDG